MSNLTLDSYQQQARTTALYPRTERKASDPIPGSNLTYVTLGLCGESGEVAEKIKKVIRDASGIITEEKKQELKKELGDVLWYVANAAAELDLNLEDVAQANLDKLFSRKARGVLTGSGDNR